MYFDNFWLGTVDMYGTQASNLFPEDGASDVAQDVILNWEPGSFADTHDVYFGTVLEEVRDASRDNPSGTLVSQGQSHTSYQPEGLLAFGQTYYWRVDEVNAAPEYTVFKGDVSGFEAELYSIPIPGTAMAVTASSFSNEYSTPDRTIDGSGLDANDMHSTAAQAMWFTATVDLDPWIQYEFDGVKKLDIMKVWNSNGPAEGAIGWGVKDVEIAYSVDGETWDVLAEANQFSRAPGLPTYDQFDAIDFKDAAAKYVRLNIKSNWGGILMSYGLSEVQFFAIPVEARLPEPASGSVDVLPDSVLTWRAGRDAAEHTIYASMDQNAVADGTAASMSSPTNSLDLTPLALQLEETYYWRVDEVNEAEDPSVWAGPVWSLSMPDALVVDDFERYSDSSPDRPFQTWLDGIGYSADEFFPVEYGGNGTGAAVGHDIWSLSSPHFGGSIMERSITIEGSAQSLPLYYSNTGVTPQTDRIWPEPQDWTKGGAQTLVLYFYGAPENTGQLFIQVNNGPMITYDGAAGDIATEAWTPWNIDLGSLGGASQSVTQLSIGVQGGSGMVLIDDILLYRNAP